MPAADPQPHSSVRPAGLLHLLQPYTLPDFLLSDPLYLLPVLPPPVSVVVHGHPPYSLGPSFVCRLFVSRGAITFRLRMSRKRAPLHPKTASLANRSIRPLRKEPRHHTPSTHRSRGGTVGHARTRRAQGLAMQGHRRSGVLAWSLSTFWVLAAHPAATPRGTKT